MRVLVVTVLSIVLLAGAAGVAAGSGRDKPPPQFPSLPSGVWSHDERNVKIKGQWHTLILDHGRVVQSSATQLTLLEPDESVVVVPLSPTTLVTPPRLALWPPTLRRGLNAIAMRIDSGAAVRIRLTLRP